MRCRLVANRYSVRSFRNGSFTNRNAAVVTEASVTKSNTSLFAGAVPADGYGSESVRIGVAADRYGLMNRALSTGADRYCFLTFRTAFAPDRYTAEACDRSSATDSDSVIGCISG